MIGAGGMGTVWRATDELLGRAVALKRMRLGGLEPFEADLARRRVLREARLAARLHHPNAITVFDVVVEDDEPWLVLEYLPSRSLDEVLRERSTLEPLEAASIGRPVAEALAAAHERGIVHRDVKPANVLMGASGTVKLTDFGISHAIGELTLTASGMLIGTPAYLAPEVAAGADATPASDVFALGATLYAASEGAPPFGNNEDGNVLALLRRAAEGRVAPPQRAGELTELLMTMLAPDPRDRPTAAEVAARLEPGTAAAPSMPTLTVSPQATGVPWTPRWRRGPVLTAAAVVAVAVLIGAAVLVVNQGAGGGSPAAAAAPPSAATTAAPVRRAAAWPVPIERCDKSHGDLVVGTIGPLTGSLSALGLGMRNAVQLAVDQANTACKVPGYRLVLRADDDEELVQNAAGSATTLKADNTVIGVIGPLASNTTAAAQPVLDAGGIVQLTTSTTDDWLTQGTDYARPFPGYFRLNGPEADEGFAAAEQVFNAAKKQRVATVTDGAGWADRVADSFFGHAVDLGGHVVLRDTVNARTQDYSEQVGRIVAQHVEAVFFAGDDVAGARLATQLRAAGVTATFVGPQSIVSDALLNGSARDGDVITDVGAAPALLPAAATFASAYQAAGFREPPAHYGTLTYDAATVLVAAIGALTTVGPWDPARRPELVRAVQDTDMAGLTGRLAFNKFGEAKYPVYTINEVRSRSLVPTSLIRLAG